MRFKIDLASLVVGIKFTVFALFYFVFEGNFPSTSPWGAYIWRGDLTEGFLCYWFGGLIFGGAYTWRGLFAEFYSISIQALIPNEVFIFFLIFAPAITRYHSSSKHQSGDMPIIRAGDLVLEVNRVVVSPNTIDKVS